MTILDTAREISLPGIVIGQVHIDPSKLSTRMKSMVKKMLRQGYTEGGWASKSKQLAEKVAQGSGIRLVGRSTRGFTAPHRGTYSPEIAEKVVALLDADEALCLMDNPDGTERYRDYSKRGYEGSRLRIRKDVTPFGRWVSMHNPELAAQCCELFASTRTPAMLEAVEKMCDRIDNNELIETTINV